jgi:hypothetical protein
MQHREVDVDKLFAKDRDTLLLSISTAWTSIVVGVLLFALFTH